MRVIADDILVWPDGHWAFRGDVPDATGYSKVIADNTMAWWDFVSDKSNKD